MTARRARRVDEATLIDLVMKNDYAPPRDWGAPSTWSARLRFEIAAVLRRLAKAIEPSRVRIP